MVTVSQSRCLDFDKVFVYFLSRENAFHMWGAFSVLGFAPTGNSQLRLILHGKALIEL